MTETQHGGPTTGEGKAVVANIHYGAAGGYAEALQRAQETGECPFCKEAAERPAEIVLRHTVNWWVKRNPYPPKSCYPPQDPIEIPAEDAFLIIPFQHVTEVSQLLPDDWSEVGYLFGWVVTEFKLPGGIFGFRWGTPLHSGRTVLHLHFPVVVPPPHPVEAGKVVPVPFWAG